MRQLAEFDGASQVFDLDLDLDSNLELHGSREISDCQNRVTVTVTVTKSVTVIP